jgi:nitrogen fixation protein NifU and related proteins
MSDLLYSRDVLRLAAAATGAGKLADATCSHTRFNPACADKTTVHLKIAGGRIAALTHETSACVLAQASASLLAGAARGGGVAELETLKAAIQAMADGGAPPEGRFAGYAQLCDAARQPGRLPCLLLPIEAAIAAAGT